MHVVRFHHFDTETEAQAFVLDRRAAHGQDPRTEAHVSTPTLIDPASLHSDSSVFYVSEAEIPSAYWLVREEIFK